MNEMDRFVADGIRAVRRVVIGVIGLTVVVIGLALLVLPGPAFLVIPIGLGILAVEFEWARRWLRRAHRLFESAAQRPEPPLQPRPPEIRRDRAFPHDDSSGADSIEGDSPEDPRA